MQFGTSLTRSADHGQFRYLPVEVRDSSARLLQRIDFRDAGPFVKTDLETVVYGQDHWAPGSRISFDFGLRLEHQSVAKNLRLAPRSGVSFTPFGDTKTVFRAAAGQFYDHVPLDVYNFAQYPIRTIRDYDSGGALIATRQPANVIGNARGPGSWLVHGARLPGAFAPRGSTWSLQAEHRFRSTVQFRAVYTDNRSVGLITLQPGTRGGIDALVLQGGGRSRYRQLEISSRLTVKYVPQMIISYTRSRAKGSLNVFDSFVGNYPTPLVRDDVYANLPGDIPHRFLMWGTMDLPLRLKLLPTVEYRSGLPWTALDERQNYVGVPNRDETRFPAFFSADARMMRDFKVRTKYNLQLALTGFNLTNHFNALTIHANIADPLHGVYFGNYRRRFRVDFDITF